MKLADCIAEVIRLSEEMLESLAADDVDAAMELLPRRGQAMGRLVSADGEAGPEDKLACRHQLRRLRELDRALQEEASRRLENLSGRVRASLGGRPSEPPPPSETVACLDRRA